MTYLKDEYVRSYRCKVMKYLICRGHGESQLGRENIALKPMCHFKSYLILVTFMPSLCKFKSWIKELGNFLQKNKSLI